MEDQILHKKHFISNCTQMILYCRL